MSEQLVRQRTVARRYSKGYALPLTVIFEGLLCGGTQERRSHNHAMLDSDEQTVLFKTGQEKGGLERRGQPVRLPKHLGEASGRCE